MSTRAIVLLIGSFVAGGAAAQGVTAPSGADPESNAAAAKPTNAAAPPTAPSAEHVPSANPLWTVPLSRLTATRERPLFSPSRRPPPPVVVAKAAPPPPPPPPKPPELEKPPLTLTGTILGAAGEGIGFFTMLSDLKPLRLKVGEDHKGWILREVRQRQAVLEKSGQGNAVLELPRRDLNKGGPNKTDAENRPAEPPAAAQPDRKAEAAADGTADTPSPPNGSPPGGDAKPRTGFSLPPSTGTQTQTVATISVQPPVLAPPPPSGNPLPVDRRMR